MSSLHCCVVVTCRVIFGDGQPSWLIGLPYIIGHFTYILSAFLLSHIVEGKHLSIRAIDPWMLEMRTSHQRTHTTGNTRHLKWSEEVHSQVNGPITIKRLIDLYKRQLKFEKWTNIMRLYFWNILWIIKSLNTLRILTCGKPSGPTRLPLTSICFNHWMWGCGSLKTLQWNSTSLPTTAVRLAGKPACSIGLWGERSAKPQMYKNV